jgi:hypothetical protein
MSFGIDDAIAAGLKVLDKFVPDPEARVKAEAELRSSLQQWDAGQAAVNKAEAENPNLFVSGWRPAIGWCCGLALFYSYLLVPLGMYVGFVSGKPLPKPPVLDGNLWELMFALLGLGGMRTYEKIKGVAA